MFGVVDIGERPELRAQQVCARVAPEGRILTSVSCIGKHIDYSASVLLDMCGMKEPLLALLMVGVGCVSVLRFCRAFTISFVGCALDRIRLSGLG